MKLLGQVKLILKINYQIYLKSYLVLIYMNFNTKVTKAVKMEAIKTPLAL